jgi:hypothetical protein
MSGRFTRSWCEAGAQTPPLLRASSPLKPKNQPRTNIENWYSERGALHRVQSGFDRCSSARDRVIKRSVIAYL